jgi:hypothetical protein
MKFVEFSSNLPNGHKGIYTRKVLLVHVAQAHKCSHNLNIKASNFEFLDRTGGTMALDKTVCQKLFVF